MWSSDFRRGPECIRAWFWLPFYFMRLSRLVILFAPLLALAAGSCGGGTETLSSADVNTCPLIFANGHTSASRR